MNGIASAAPASMKLLTAPTMAAAPAPNSIYFFLAAASINEYIFSSDGGSNWNWS